MSFEPQSHEEYDRIVGKAVYGSDNEQTGTIDQVMHPANESSASPQRGHVFLVKSGPFGGALGLDELYIPERAVQMVSQDRVVISATKDEIKDRGWGEPPTGDYH